MIFQTLSAKFYLAQPLRSTFDMADKTLALALELIELEKLNAALDWNDWHDKLSEDIEAENSEPVETKTDYCNRMGFDM
jgi:ABC-type uncharacterized transport system fused permease/ATPase subunit